MREVRSRALQGRKKAQTHPFNPAATRVGSFSCGPSRSWRRCSADSLASSETFGLWIALFLLWLSEGSLLEMYTELNYPFKPAATFFGSLSGIAAALPESTSWECCLESSDVSGVVRTGDVTAERVIYWDC